MAAEQPNDEAVAHFMAITGANEQVANHTLESANWDVEQAVNIYMETNDATSAPPTRTSASSSAAEQTINQGLFPQQQQDQTETSVPSQQPDEEGVRPALPSRQEQLIGPWGMHATEDFRMPQVVDTFRDFSRGHSGSNPKKRSLAELFSPPHDLILPMVFGDAKSYATEQKKWLLVNIQNAQIFDSQRLNRDTWKDDGVKDYIRTYFIFWQQWHTDKEAKRVMDLYKLDPEKLPALLIIDPRTGELVWKRVGFMEPHMLLRELFEFISINPFDKNGPPTVDIKDDSIGASGHGSSSRKRVSYDEEARELEKAIAASLSEKNHDDGDEALYVSDDDDDIVVCDSDDASESTRDQAMGAQVSASASSTNARENTFSEETPPNVAENNATLQEQSEAEEITEDEGPDAAQIKVMLPDGSRKVMKVFKWRDVSRLYALVAKYIGVVHSIGQRTGSATTELSSSDTWDLQTTFPAESLTKYLNMTVADAKLHGSSLRVRVL